MPNHGQGLLRTPAFLRTTKATVMNDTLPNSHLSRYRGVLWILLLAIVLLLLLAMVAARFPKAEPEVPRSDAGEVISKTQTRETNQ